MIDQISIINMAVSQMKQQSISGLTEDSILAEKMRLYYEQTVKTLLAERAWSFASTIKSYNGIENPESDAWNNGFLYQYKMPQNAVRRGKIFDLEGYVLDNRPINTRTLNDLYRKGKFRDVFSVELNDLYCNEPKLFIQYTFYDPDNPNSTDSYSDNFRWALIYSLAANLSKVFDSVSGAQLMTAKAQLALAKAITQDKIQNEPRRFLR